MTKSPSGLISIFSGGRCLGQLLSSCRGYRLFDARDMELGSYPSQHEAVAALLTYSGVVLEDVGNADVMGVESSAAPL